MSSWTLILLLLSVAYLAYRHPRTIMDYLPQWLRPGAAAQASQDQRTGQDDQGKESTGAGSSSVQIVVGDDDESVQDSTPKAKAANPVIPVPSLSLDEENQVRAAAVSTLSTTSKMQPPLSNSMPPPPLLQKKAPSKSASSLVPPPSRPNLAPPPSSASGLRVPSSGPVPNRGPPANSQQRVNGGLSANGVVNTPNPRGKVLLAPGHSPMDWAALTRSSNLSGVPTFQRVTPSMLKSMTGRKGKPAWSSWQGKVYNITPYLDFHPGGRNELMKAAGRDGTKLFMDVHPWVNWENMLGACLVGALVFEGHGMIAGGTDLEDID